MITLTKFDQSRKEERTTYGEAVRLSNTIRAKPSQPITNIYGQIISWKDPQAGFDVEDADYNKFTAWLSDMTKKKSQSLFWFVIRVMAWRFPENHSQIRQNLAVKHQLEFDYILSNMRHEVEWLGEVSYQNMVRYDGSLTANNVEVIRKNDGVSVRTKK